MYTVIFVIVAIVVAYFLFELFIISQGAFFAKTNDKQIKTIIKFAGRCLGKKAIDLGSGNGEIVAALAEKGAKAVGFEIHPLHFYVSKKLLKYRKVEKNVQIYCKSFWQENLGKYDIIVVYGIPHIMDRLSAKIVKESKSNAKIISIGFKFPKLKMIKEENEVRLYKLEG